MRFRWFASTCNQICKHLHPFATVSVNVCIHVRPIQALCDRLWSLRPLLRTSVIRVDHWQIAKRLSIVIRNNSRQFFTRFGQSSCDQLWPLRPPVVTVCDCDHIVTPNQNEIVIQLWDGPPNFTLLPSPIRPVMICDHFRDRLRPKKSVGTLHYVAILPRLIHSHQSLGVLWEAKRSTSAAKRRVLRRFANQRTANITHLSYIFWVHINCIVCRSSHFENYTNTFQEQWILNPKSMQIVSIQP